MCNGILHQQRGKDSNKFKQKLEARNQNTYIAINTNLPELRNSLFSLTKF